MSDTPMKRCSKCEQEFPATREYFIVRRGDTLKSICRACHNAKQRRRYANDPEHKERTQRRNRKHLAEYKQDPDYRNRELERRRRADHPDDYEEWLAAHNLKRQMKAQGLKYCGGCKQWLPNTADYFPRNSARKDGLGTQCKRCHRRYILNRIESDPEFAAYYREYSRTYHAQCQATSPEYRARRIANSAVNSKRPEVRKRYNEQQNRRRKERIAADPDYLKRAGEQQRLNWHIRRDSDPEFAQRERLKVEKRRARKQNLPDNHALEDWQRAIEYFGNRCAVCGCAEDKRRLLVPDHWIPLSAPDCPGTIASNIVPLCHTRKGHAGAMSCNLSKGNSDPANWLNLKFGEERAKEILARIEAYFAWVHRQE